MKSTYEQEKLRLARDQAGSLKRIADALEIMVTPPKIHVDPDAQQAQPVMTTTPAAQFPHFAQPTYKAQPDPDDDEVEPMNDEDNG